MSSESTKGSSAGQVYSILHKVFQIGLILKGANAIIELAGGAVLLYFPTGAIRDLVSRVFASIPILSTNSLVKNLVIAFNNHLTPDGQAFGAWYLLSHGIIKIMVVICLLRGWFWAYPVGIVVFIGFMVFQTWEYFIGSHSWMFLALDAFDAFLIWLTILEWRHFKMTSQ